MENLEDQQKCLSAQTFINRDKSPRITQTFAEFDCQKEIRIPIQSVDFTSCYHGLKQNQWDKIAKQDNVIKVSKLAKQNQSSPSHLYQQITKIKKGVTFINGFLSAELNIPDQVPCQDYSSLLRKEIKRQIKEAIISLDYAALHSFLNPKLSKFFKNQTSQKFQISVFDSLTHAPQKSKQYMFLILNSLNKIIDLFCEAAECPVYQLHAMLKFERIDIGSKSIYYNQEGNFIIDHWTKKIYKRQSCYSAYSICSYFQELKLSKIMQIFMAYVLNYPQSKRKEAAQKLDRFLDSQEQMYSHTVSQSVLKQQASNLFCIKQKPVDISTQNCRSENRPDGVSTRNLSRKATIYIETQDGLNRGKHDETEHCSQAIIINKRYNDILLRARTLLRSQQWGQEQIIQKRLLQQQGMVFFDDKKFDHKGYSKSSKDIKWVQFQIRKRPFHVSIKGQFDQIKIVSQIFDKHIFGSDMKMIEESDYALNLHYFCLLPCFGKSSSQELSKKKLICNPIQLELKPENLPFDTKTSFLQPTYKYDYGYDMMLNRVFKKAFNRETYKKFIELNRRQNQSCFINRFFHEVLEKFSVFHCKQIIPQFGSVRYLDRVLLKQEKEKYQACMSDNNKKTDQYRYYFTIQFDEDERKLERNHASNQKEKQKQNNYINMNYMWYLDKDQLKKLITIKEFFDRQKNLSDQLQINWETKAIQVKQQQNDFIVNEQHRQKAKAFIKARFKKFGIKRQPTDEQITSYIEYNRYQQLTQKFADDQEHKQQLNEIIENLSGSNQKLNDGTESFDKQQSGIHLYNEVNLNKRINAPFLPGKIKQSEQSSKVLKPDILQSFLQKIQNQDDQRVQSLSLSENLTNNIEAKKTTDEHQQNISLQHLDTSNSKDLSNNSERDLSENKHEKKNQNVQSIQFSRNENEKSIFSDCLSNTLSKLKVLGQQEKAIQNQNKGYNRNESYESKVLNVSQEQECASFNLNQSSLDNSSMIGQNNQQKQELKPKDEPITSNNKNKKKEQKPKDESMSFEYGEDLNNVSDFKFDQDQ